MSIVKNKGFYITLILIFVSLFAFGCKVKNPVESVSFNTSAFNGGVVMLVGETYSPEVEVLPSFASDKSYSLFSSNNDVIKIKDNSIVAVGAGKAYLTARSNQNGNIEDSVMVTVYAESQTLDVPQNLTYSNENETISFKSVVGAVGYTLSINGAEINLGNSTSYTLQAYSEFLKLNTPNLSAYNTVLAVKVRADAPSFTRALVSSGFENSQEIKFYQTEAVENVEIKTNEDNQSVLTFSHEKSTSFNIILNGKPWANTQEKSLTLMDLPADYANSMVNLQIEALLDSSVYAGNAIETDENATVFTSSNGVNYYSSFSKNHEIYVYGNPAVEIEADTAKWQRIGGVEKYKISVDDKQVLQAENFLDLSAFATTNGLIESQEYTFVVEPLLNGSNIAKSKPEEDVKFSILPSPEISVEGTIASWSGVSKLYEITIYDADGAEKFSAKTQANNYDLSTQINDANKYSVAVNALGYYDDETGLNYINSKQNKISVQRNEIPQISVDNYELKLNLINGEQYKILFDDEPCDELFKNFESESAIYDSVTHILTATQRAQISIDLKNTTFLAGEHEITVVQLGSTAGENAYSLPSQKAVHKFLQLEKVESLTILNGVASASLSATNSAENSYIYFEMESESKKTTAVGTILEDSVSYEINTTNAEREDFLTSGTYTITICLGNGSSSFGYIENGEVVKNASNEFEVLKAPNLLLNDSAKCEISLDGEHDKFDVYSSGDGGEFSKLETIETNTFVFELNEGSICFKVQAIGDGTTTLNSSLSESFKYTRLYQPTLIYNKESGFSIADDNAPENVKNYSVNGVAYTKENVNTFKPTFEVGNNEFKLIAHANNADAQNEFYLDSNEFVLIINKIDAQADISICEDENFSLANNGNYFNHIKISPQNLGEEYKLNVKFTIGENTFAFKSENGNLISTDEHGYTLPYVYAAGSYYIALLQANFTPIIAEMKNESERSLSFSISIVFDSDEDTKLSSLEETATLSVLPRTTISRNEQDITIKHVVQSYNLTGYALFVNNKIIRLTEGDATLKDGEFYLPFETVESLLGQNEISFADDEVFAIQVVTLNNANLGLCSLSEKFYLTRASAVKLSTSKNVADLDADNSLVISFKALENDYSNNLSYYIKAYNVLDAREVNIISTSRNNQSKDESGMINVSLEKIEGYENLSGTIYFEVYVLINSSFENSNTVNVFNSHKSETLEISKLNAVQNLFIGATRQEDESIINEGYLQFSYDDMSSVAYFEIWNMITNQKLGTTTNTFYNLDALVESANIAVKVVSILSDGNATFSNSNFSKNISATKITITSSIDNGDFCLDVPLLANLKDLIETGNIYIEISNSSLKDYIYIDFDNSTDVEFDYAKNKIYISADKILTYGENALVDESVTFQIKTRLLSASGETYYTNSNIAKNTVKGLMSVENLSMSFLTDDGEYVDAISWQNNAINLTNSLTFSYAIKLIYNGKTYTSRQGKFYYNETVINENVTVSKSSINLPTSFKTATSTINFSEGQYQLFIKVVADGEQGFVSSRYLQTVINILPAPKPFTLDGHLEWDEQPYAQGYAVRVIKGENERVWTSTETTNKFDFVLDELSETSGVLAVQVQAVGNVKNQLDGQVLNSTLSSRWSEKFYVYKLPNLVFETGARINDGTLVLNANKFISGAQVEFVSEDYSKTITFNREAETTIQQDIQTLGITSWQTASEPALAGMQELKHMIVKDVGSEILNLPEGVSFSINIRLLGNTSSAQVLPIISSGTTKNVANISAVKMATTSVSANTMGEFKFGENSGSTANDVNYNFNDADSADENVKNAKIFKINLSIKNLGGAGNNNLAIYALDYNYFTQNIENKLTDLYATYDGGYGGLYAYYKLNQNGQEIYLNVYSNNTINFRNDKLWYHEIIVQENDGEYVYSMPSGEPKNVDITLGGTFEINAHLLGGDSGEKTSYLTSSATEKRFIRYNIGTLLSNNGEIKFKDARTENGIEDNPVYKITATSTNSQLNKTFYLYYTSEDEAKTITSNAQGEYVQIQDIDKQDYVLFNISSYLESSAYDITIQTLAGMGSTDGENYLLNSYTSLGKTFYKLSNVKFEVETTVGVRLNLSFLTNATNNIINSTNRFEITLFDGSQTYVYEIDEHSNGVAQANGKIIYTLPASIVVDNEDVNIDTAKTYNLKIRALAPISDSENLILNGSYGTENINVKKADAIVQTKIENGKLMFEKPAGYENSSVSIQISYLVADNLYKTITIPTLGAQVENGWYSYELDDYEYAVDGAGSERIVGKRDYFVKIMVYGNTPSSSLNYYVLNSDYSLPIAMNRLQEVDASSITAVDGVLTWKLNDEIIDRDGKTNSAIGYKIILNDEQTFVANAEENSLDLTSIAPGEYSVKIITLGNEVVNSITSAAQYSFVKLSDVNEQSVAIADKGRMLNWQAVEDLTSFAQQFKGEEGFSVGYKVTIKYGVNSSYTRFTTSPSCDLLSAISGEFLVQIQATAQGKGNVLASQVVECTRSLSRPENPIREILYDENLNRFYFDVDNSLYIGDKIVVNYNVREYQYNDGNNLDPLDKIESYEIRFTGAGRYYFAPEIMGLYTSVSVAIERDGGGISNLISYNIGAGLDLHIFNAGNGEDKPYKIFNEQELLNIYKRANANFILQDSITLTVDAIASHLSSTKDGENQNGYYGVLANTFAGSLDGNNKTISAGEINLTNQNFALFGEIVGESVIKSLTLNNFKIGISSTITDEDRFVALIAMSTTNAQLQNLEVTSASINIYGANSSSRGFAQNVYMAGLINNAINTNLLGCHIAVAFEYNVNANSDKYIGGMVSKAVGGKISVNQARQNVLTVSLQYNQAVNFPITYFGGAVGYFTSQERTIIENVSVTLTATNVRAQYFGGIVGYADNVTIQNCQVATSETLTATMGAKTTSETTAGATTDNRFGGIVGYANNCTISTNTVDLTLSLNVLSGDSKRMIYLGIIAGEINGSTVQDCSSKKDFTAGKTELKTGIMNTLGVYGNSTNSTVGETKRI